MDKGALGIAEVFSSKSKSMARVSQGSQGPGLDLGSAGGEPGDLENSAGSGGAGASLSLHLLRVRDLTAAVLGLLKGAGFSQPWG